LDVDAIQDFLGKSSAKVSLATKAARQLTFQGPAPLTFAFTTVRFHVAHNGTITSMLPGDQSIALSDFDSDTQLVTYGLDRVQLDKGPAMIEWDQWDDPD